MNSITSEAISIFQKEDGVTAIVIIGSVTMTGTNVLALYQSVFDAFPQQLQTCDLGTHPFYQEVQ